MKDLDLIFQDDEQIHDYEFAERLYNSGLSLDEDQGFSDEDVIWQDFY